MKTYAKTQVRIKTWNRKKVELRELGEYNTRRRKKLQLINPPSVSDGLDTNSVTDGEELDKRLKSKYSIKESWVILREYLYDDSIPLHMRCFLSCKRKLHKEVAENSERERSLDVSTNNDDISCNGSSDSFIKSCKKKYSGHLKRNSRKISTSSTECEEKTLKTSGAGLSQELLSIIQNTPVSSWKNLTTKIKRHEILRGNIGNTIAEEKWKIHRFTETHTDDSSTDSCETQVIKIKVRKLSDRDEHVVKSVTVCNNEKESPTSHRITLPEKRSEEDLFRTKQLNKRRRYSNQLHPLHSEDISAFIEESNALQQNINVPNLLKNNHNVSDTSQNTNETIPWKPSEIEIQNTLMTLLSPDMNLTDVHSTKYLLPEPTNIEIKTNALESLEKKSPPSSQQVVECSVTKEDTKCGSKSYYRSDVLDLPLLSTLQLDDVSMVPDVNLVNAVHNVNNTSTITPTEPKDNLEYVVSLITKEKPTETNFCNYETSEIDLLACLTDNNGAIDHAQINNEILTGFDVTNFDLTFGQKQNCNEIHTENNKSNAGRMLEEHVNKSPAYVTPENLKTNVNDSSRNLTHSPANSRLSNKTVANTEEFSNHTPSTGNRKLPRITEDSILPKDTVNFSLKHHYVQQEKHKKDLSEADGTKEQKWPENSKNVNNDITERYFASIKNANNDITERYFASIKNANAIEKLLDMPSLGDESVTKGLHNTITLRAPDDSSSVTLALTADNLQKFTNGAEVSPAVNEAAQTTTAKCGEGKDESAETANNKQLKRRKRSDSDKNSIHSREETKRIRLNKSTCRQNSADSSHSTSSASSSSQVTSENVETGESDATSDESTDKKSTQHSVLSEKSRGPDSSTVIQSADTVQFCTPRKNSSVTSTETEVVAREAVDFPAEKRSSAPKNCRANLTVEPASEEIVPPETPNIESNPPDENRMKSLGKLDEKPKALKQTKRAREIVEEDNEDIINLYVDEEDLLSQCYTEECDIKANQSGEAKLQSVESSFGANAPRKETKNVNGLSDTESGNGSTSNCFFFDFNTYLKKNKMEFDKTCDTIEANVVDHGQFPQNENLTWSKVNDRKMVDDTQSSSTTSFGQRRMTVANRLGTSSLPLIATNCNPHRRDYQNGDSDINNTFYIRKIFMGYCFTLLKAGSCYREDDCYYKHNIRPLVQRVCYQERYDHLAVLEYVIEMQYLYIAKIIYIEVLQFVDNVRVIELYKKLLEGQIENYMVVNATVNALLGNGMDLEKIVSVLTSCLHPNNVKMQSLILDAVEKHAPKDKYWSTLKASFLRAKLNASHNGQIHGESASAALPLAHNLTYDERYLATSLAEVQYDDHVNDDTGAPVTIASPDPAEKAAYIANEMALSMSRKGNVSCHERTVDREKAVQHTWVCDDGKSRVVNSIDNLPEPTSVYRDRFWKFNLDVQRVREGLKHHDYQYVIEVLDTYADSNERTLIARSFYNILRAEIKRSQYHLNNLIERTVQAGSLAALDIIIQAGKYVLKALVQQALWGLAYALQKSLQHFNFSVDAEFVLLVAEIYIANRCWFKALILLRQHNIIRSSRTKWRVLSNENDSKTRTRVVGLLLEMFCKQSAEFAFSLFTFLLREQDSNYSPIDLSLYINKLMSQLLSENCTEMVKAVVSLAIDSNFTFNTITFRAIVAYLYHHDMSLAKQMYRYADGLGVYNAIWMGHRVFVRINMCWSEEEIYFVFWSLFEKLIEDIGPGIDRLKQEQLKINVIFEILNMNDWYGHSVKPNCLETLKKHSILTVRKILETRFRPSIKIWKRKVNAFFQLHSISVVKYLRSMK